MLQQNLGRSTTKPHGLSNFAHHPFVPISFPAGAQCCQGVNRTVGILQHDGPLPRRSGTRLHKGGTKWAGVVTSSLALPAPGPGAAEEPLNRFDSEIMALSLPALASLLLEPIMGVINSGMVGRLGTQQLGAVSVASISVSLSIFLFSFLLFLTTPDIASANIKGDKAEVSRISARSLWVAGFFGIITSLTLVLSGPAMVRMMAPPEPAVALYATQYIGIRAWGVLPALLGFVATGTYRGVKDTKTPLFAAMGGASVSLVLNYLFINVFMWGVPGSAIAITLAQTLSSSTLCFLLVKKKLLHLEDLMQVPSWESVSPMLRKGLVLGIRNVVSFSMVMYASLLCVRAGSVYQASFEVVRQVWILSIQAFECLNVATQTLCAMYLGAGDRKSAMAVMTRLLQLGVSVAVCMAVVIFFAQIPVVSYFSRDPTVIAQTLAALPMICFFFPVDAFASIMDGSLLAARQTDYMSYVQIAGSLLQYGALIMLANNGWVNALNIWSVLKILTVIRVVGGAHRNWFSADSAYKGLSTVSEPSTISAHGPIAPLPSTSASTVPAGITSVATPMPTLAAVDPIVLLAPVPSQHDEAPEPHSPTSQHQPHEQQQQPQDWTPTASSEEGSRSQGEGQQPQQLEPDEQNQANDCRMDELQHDDSVRVLDGLLEQEPGVVSRSPPKPVGICR